MRILVVDNYDSFVFNLVQYLGQLGVEAQVWRNDDARLSDPAAIAAEVDGVLLSPGPGTPGTRRAHRSTWCAPAPRPTPRCWACAWGIRPSASRSAPPWIGLRSCCTAKPAGLSHEYRCAARTSRSLHGDPVSLADHPAGNSARRAGGDRTHRQWGDHGCAAHRSADPRGSVPSGIDTHRRRPSNAGQLAGLLRSGPGRRVGAAAGKRGREQFGHGAASR